MVRLIHNLVVKGRLISQGTLIDETEEDLAFVSEIPGLTIEAVEEPEPPPPEEEPPPPKPPRVWERPKVQPIGTGASKRQPVASAQSLKEARDSGYLPIRERVLKPKRKER